MKRMRLFVDGLIHQTRRYKLPTELVMVEWVPPEDRPLLKEVLPKPGPGDYLTIRYIIVPHEAHATFPRHKDFILYQMIAKNVGLRRAKGKFVVSTCIDLLWNDALFERLAKQDLDPQCFYRVNRWDIPKDVDESWTWEQKMEYGRKNTMTIHGRDSRFPHVKVDIYPKYNKFPPRLWWAGLTSNLWAKLFPSPEQTFQTLDTNAAGDFTLMSKEAWLDIRGHIEIDGWAVHLDSVVIAQAASLGYKQVIFPTKARAYHIDHHTGWMSMNPEEKLHYIQKRPGMGWDFWKELMMYLLEEPRRLGFNPENWGFADWEFTEYELGP